MQRFRCFETFVEPLSIVNEAFYSRFSFESDNAQFLSLQKSLESFATFTMETTSFSQSSIIDQGRHKRLDLNGSTDWLVFDSRCNYR